MAPAAACSHAFTTFACPRRYPCRRWPDGRQRPSFGPLHLQCQRAVGRRADKPLRLRPALPGCRRLGILLHGGRPCTLQRSTPLQHLPGRCVDRLRAGCGRRWRLCQRQRRRGRFGCCGRRLASSSRRPNGAALRKPLINDRCAYTALLCPALSAGAANPVAPPATISGSRPQVPPAGPFTAASASASAVASAEESRRPARKPSHRSTGIASGEAPLYTSASEQQAATASAQASSVALGCELAQAVASATAEATGGSLAPAVLPVECDASSVACCSSRALGAWCVKCVVRASAPTRAVWLPCPLPQCRLCAGQRPPLSLLQRLRQRPGARLQRRLPLPGRPRLWLRPGPGCGQRAEL